MVLSRAFFSKGWTNYELDGLVQIVLPIWQNVSKQEVLEYSAFFADKLVRNTAMHSVEEIAAEIVEVIRDA